MIVSTELCIGEESAESVHSNESGSHDQEEPHHPTDHTKIALKPILCWIGAALVWAVEIVIHATCGFSKDAFEMEEEGDCKDWIWARWLIVVEGICRSGTAVVAVGVLWTFFSTHCKSGRLPEILSCPTSFCELLKRALWFILPAFTLAVGLVVAFHGNEPEWMAVFAHICDIMCHTVITTAIIGFLHDLVLVGLHGGLKSLTYAYLCCFIELEASGLGEGPVPGIHDKTYFDELRALRASEWQVCRTLLMWLAFAAVTIIYVLINSGAKLLVEIRIGIGALNASCWATIAWAVVNGIRRRQWSVFRKTEIGVFTEPVSDMKLGTNFENCPISESSDTDESDRGCRN